MPPAQQPWRMNKKSSLQTKFYGITRDRHDVPHLRLKVVGPDLQNFLSPAHDILGTFILNPRTKASLLEDLQRITGVIYGLKFDDSFDSDNWTEYGEGCETQKIETLELTLLKPQARKGQVSVVD